jgi:hypothetical protein
MEKEEAESNIYAWKFDVEAMEDIAMDVSLQTDDSIMGEG